MDTLVNDAIFPLSWGFLFILVDCPQMGIRPRNKCYTQEFQQEADARELSSVWLATD
jgi:hypothetical protein